MSNRKHHYFRQDKGNMLVLGCCTMTLTALAIVVGYSFAGLVFIQNRLQTSADEIALAGALKLNEMGRLGQMNNMVARSRQMVYAQRAANDSAGMEADEVQHLATQLLDEAKSSAQDLEVERQHLLSVSTSEANTAMANKYEDIQVTYQMVLPWLKIDRPTVTFQNLGKIAQVQSNVTELPIQANLDTSDRTGGRIQSSSGLNLYKESMNHKLPTSDGALDFKLSSLPAPVNGIVSPARVVLGEEFQTVPDNYLYSAAQVQLSLNVETGLGPHAASRMTATGTAITSGGTVQE
jgi:hypothetical protein